MLLEYVKARTKANHKATQSDTKRHKANQKQWNKSRSTLPPTASSISSMSVSQSPSLITTGLSLADMSETRLSATTTSRFTTRRILVIHTKSTSFGTALISLRPQHGLLLRKIWIFVCIGRRMSMGF